MPWNSANPTRREAAEMWREPTYQVTSNKVWLAHFEYSCGLTSWQLHLANRNHPYQVSRRVRQ